MGLWQTIFDHNIAMNRKCSVICNEPTDEVEVFVILIYIESLVIVQNKYDMAKQK